MASSGRSKRYHDKLTQRLLRAALSWLLLFTLILGICITILISYGEGENEWLVYRQVLTELVNEVLTEQVFSRLQLPDEPALRGLEFRLQGIAQVRLIKIKTPDGRIIWSDHPDLIGHVEPASPQFMDALAGKVIEGYERTVDIANGEETFIDRWLHSWASELYIPFKAGSGHVLGVAEIYLPPRISAREMVGELAMVWLILGSILIVYLLLSHRWFVRATDRIITLQEEHEKDVRLATVGEGVSKIVHDTRNLLAGMRFACERLTSENMTAGQRGDLLNQLSLPIEMSFGMLEDILAFASGKSAKIKKREQGLRPLIEHLQPILSPMLDEAGHRLVLDIPDDLSVYVDADKMAHILINLVRNSIEAMPSPGEVRIAATACKAGVCITISDTGTGIEPYLLPRLFEPFASHPGMERTGLGLAIVQDLVRIHGGEVMARNRQKSGAEFELIFPAQQTDGSLKEQ
jgi:signal transduction histidine kinase